MKHQYFGDVNDYKKYGLLRTLADAGNTKVVVGWMLTENDLGSDGNRTTYLNNLALRVHDPSLFDSLKQVLNLPIERSVFLAEQHRLIPGAIYHTDLLEDDRLQRLHYFQNLAQKAQGSHFVFLDPDNGLEIKTVRKGNKGSSKYLYWDEVVNLYELGLSVLLYQHFRRVKREVFIQQIAFDLIAQTSALQVMVFSTAHTAFFLIPQAAHQVAFSSLIEQVTERWYPEIIIQRIQR